MTPEQAQAQACREVAKAIGYTVSKAPSNLPDGCYWMTNPKGELILLSAHSTGEGCWSTYPLFMEGGAAAREECEEWLLRKHNIKLSIGQTVESVWILPMRGDRLTQAWEYFASAGSGSTLAEARAWAITNAVRAMTGGK